MKITKQELIELEACADCLKRFIKQTNDTDDSVEVISLIGGENTYGDLLWLAGKKFPKERIVRFACDCALLNIELIEPYTNKYNLIVEFLRNPTAAEGIRAAGRAAGCATSRATGTAATYAAFAAGRAIHAARATNAAAHSATTAYAATYAGNGGKVDELLGELFA